MSNLLGIAVKGVASGIGLASESIHAYKAKNHDKDNNSNETTITDADSTRQLIREEDDEEDWELDEAQEALTPQETKTKPSRDITILVQQFVSRHPLPSGVELSSIPRLALPVILPQRRPKDRSRGFIRAYAPLLEDCEVDQAAFFDFLDVFNQATLASPWIQAINLAGIAGFFLPGATSLAITAAVMLTIKASQEVQGRQKTNTFLDKINDEFFRPRGLYCLILTWNPETASVQSTFSLAETISSSTSTGTGFQKVTKKFQTSSGNTYGDLEIPQAAPLIFPGLDTLALRSGEGVVKKVSKLKKSKGFVENYMDRRARAKFSGENPDSMLSEGPKDEFTSRYADPNHPSNSGSIISLATGGYVNPPPLGSQRRDHMQGGGGFLGGVLSGGGSQDAHQNTQAGRGGLLGSSLGRCADFEKRRGFGSRDRGALLGRGGLFGRGSGGTRGPGLLGGILGGRKDSTPTITPAASSQNSAPQEQGRPNPDRGASGRLGLGGSSGNNGLIGGGFTAVKKILGRNVLYLMIVNLPTEEEITASTSMAAEERKRQGRDLMGMMQDFY